MEFCKWLIALFKQIFVFLSCGCCCFKCDNNNNNNNNNNKVGDRPQLEGGRIVQHGSKNKQFKKFSHFFVEVTKTPKEKSLSNNNNNENYSIRAESIDTISNNEVVISSSEILSCICGKHVESVNPSNQRVEWLCECRNPAQIKIKNTLIVSYKGQQVTAPYTPKSRHLYTVGDEFTREKAVEITERRGVGYTTQNTVFEADPSDFYKCQGFEYGYEEHKLNFWISGKPVQAIQCVDLRPFCIGKRHAIFQDDNWHFHGYVYKTVIFEDEP